MKKVFASFIFIIFFLLFACNRNDNQQRIAEFDAESNNQNIAKETIEIINLQEGLSHVNLPDVNENIGELKLFENLNIETTRITIYGINNFLTDTATIYVLVADQRGMIHTVAKGDGIISSGIITVELTIIDESDMLNTSERYPENGSFYIGILPDLEGLPPPLSGYMLIYGDYESVAFDKEILELDYSNFR